MAAPPGPPRGSRGVTRAPSFVPVVPALRWSDSDGYGLNGAPVEAALRRGVVGFIFFGGEAEAARAAADELEARAGRRLLLGSDLERGAGQQFRGATALPPLAALGALDDLEVTRAAGALTGAEAVALGVPWVFAPVADLALEPENPIVATRSFGRDPERVSRHVAAWILGCLEAGAIPCVKHFPGHGRTVEDSHAALPTVQVSRDVWDVTDGLPFAAAVANRVPSVMTAHVAYPALDPSGRPATRSPVLIDGLLRGELGFDGVVVTDALIMEGAGSADAAAREALGAGVDVLLYPPDGLDVDRLLGDPVPGWDREASWRRVEALLASAGGGTVPSRPSVEDAPAWGRPAARARAAEWAQRGLRIFRGPEAGPEDDARRTASPAGGADARLAAASAMPAAGPLLLCTVDDDLGGPYPPSSREPFLEGLRGRGWELAEAPPGESREGARHLLAVYGEPRAWKGRAGLSAEAREAVRSWAGATRDAERCVVVFGGPRLLEDLPEELHGILAWGGEAVMQEAVARSRLPFHIDPRASE